MKTLKELEQDLIISGFQKDEDEVIQYYFPIGDHYRLLAHCNEEKGNYWLQYYDTKSLNEMSIWNTPDNINEVMNLIKLLNG